VQLRRPKNPGRVAIVAGGSLLAVNLAVFAALSQDTSTPREDRPEAIEQLFPAENAQARPQDAIVVDLADDLQGVIYIDDVRIPEDQLEGDASLGQVIFRPGDDQQFEELPDGVHNIVVEYWSRTKTLEQATAEREIFSYSWQVTVGF
jgi:hypothetical protein